MSINLSTTVKYTAQLLLWCIFGLDGFRKTREILWCYITRITCGCNRCYLLNITFLRLSLWPLSLRTNDCRNDDDLMIWNLISFRVKLSIFPLHNHYYAGEFMFDSSLIPNGNRETFVNCVIEFMSDVDVKWLSLPNLIWIFFFFIHGL